MEKIGEIHYGRVAYGYQSASHATDVKCSDGKRRYAKITSEPDTYFSLPASVKVQGKTVTGFLTTDHYNPADFHDDRRDVFFHANKYGKNGGLLP